MRKRSAAETAKRNKAFFEKLARRNNPVRGTMALPRDVDLTEVDWNADFAERGFTRLAELDAAFARAELQYLRARCKALEAIISADQKAE